MAKMVYKFELLQANQVGTLFKLIVNFLNLKHIYLTTSSEKIMVMSLNLFVSLNVGASNLSQSCPFLDIFLEILMYIVGKNCSSFGLDLFDLGGKSSKRIKF